jgi:hypothetical protein
MGHRVAAYTIDEVEYEIYGDVEMFPAKDEKGNVLRDSRFDHYDIYVYSDTLKCLNCITENKSFKTIPTEKELRNYLDISNL